MYLVVSIDEAVTSDGNATVEFTTTRRDPIANDLSVTLTPSAPAVFALLLTPNTRLIPDMPKRSASTSRICWFPSRTAVTRHLRLQRPWFVPVRLT